MAKTDWTMRDTVMPEDMNQIGEEINEAKLAAAEAEDSANQYTDQQIAVVNEDITAIEEKLSDDDVRDLTINNRLSVIHTDQATPLHLNKIKGRTVVNHVPLFDSGAWTSIHVNATVTSTKITYESSGTYQMAGYHFLSLKPNTVYTLSLITNGRVLIRAGHDPAGDIINPYIEGSISTLRLKHITFTTPSDGLVTLRLDTGTYDAGTFTFENIMLNEGSEVHEFVAGLKNLRGAYIKRYGKNLLPPFSEWTFLVSGATPQDSYTMVHKKNSTGVSEQNYVRVPIQGGKVYTLSGTVQGSPEGVVAVVNAYDEDNTQVLNHGVANIADGFFSFQVTVPENAVYAQVYLYAASSFPVGSTATFTNPMFSLGSETMTFEPQNNDYLYADVELASNQSGSVADILEYRDGRYWKTRWYESVTLNSDWPWFRVNRTLAGYKQVAIPAGNFTPTTYPIVATVVKYNGVVLNAGNAEAVEEVYGMANDGYFRINIPNEDSGWGDNYTPTVDEIKAYFLGWRMYRAGSTNSTGLVDDSSVEKRWSPLASFDGTSYSGYVTTVPTTPPSPEVLSGGTWRVAREVKPYQLQYQLAEPIIEDVTDKVEGSISLHTGDNLVEMGEAVVVREVAVSDYTTAEHCIINHSTRSPLKHRAVKILDIYKNGEVDTGNWELWTYGSSTSYGPAWARIPISLHDPNAIYTVTYIAEPYAYSSSVQAIDVQYATNIKTALDRTVQDVADLTTRVSEIPSIYATKYERVSFVKPTLVSGWASDPDYPIQYYKDQFGYLCIEGCIHNDGGIAYSRAFTLASGFRPTVGRFIGVPTASTVGQVLLEIRSNGDVFVELNGNAKSVAFNTRIRL